MLLHMQEVDEEFKEHLDYFGVNIIDSTGASDQVTSTALSDVLQVPKSKLTTKADVDKVVKQVGDRKQY